MTRHLDIERILDGFLSDGANELADHVLDAALTDINTTRQRRSWWPAWRFPLMNSALRYAMAAALVAVVLIGGIAILPRDNLGGPSPTLEPTASQTDPPPTTEPTAPPIANLRLPGARANEVAGDYGWTGAIGSMGGMHRVGGDGSQTQLVFEVANDCFARGSADAPIPMTVAGLEALYLEPYEAAPQFIFKSGRTSGGYALPIGDRTLCVYLTWDAATTQAELDAARAVVESIRGETFGETGIRINFTLPVGWDTG